MTYHIYERDSLILTDLFEALTLAEKVMVYELSALDDAVSVAKSDLADPVFVLSLNEAETTAPLKNVLSRLPRGKVVVIANQEPTCLAEYRESVFVRRPFSSESLAESLSGKISVRQ